MGVGTAKVESATAAPPAVAANEVVVRDLLISLATAHPELLSFDGRGSLKGQVAMFLTTYEDVMAGLPEAVASARANIKKWVEQQAAEAADAAEARRKQMEHRSKVRAGPVDVRRTAASRLPDGLSAEEQALLTQARSAGVGPRAAEVD